MSNADHDFQDEAVQIIAAELRACNDRQDGGGGSVAGTWEVLADIDTRLAHQQKALMPFARDAEAFDRSEATYGDGTVFERLSGDYHWRFTVADVRAARAALRGDPND